MRSCAKRSLCSRADRQRVVDHVRRRVALGRRVDVHPEPVLGVRPGARRGARRPSTQPRFQAAYASRRLGVGRAFWRDLPHDVGVVAVDRLLPLLVGIEELVPVGRLQRGPLLRVAGGAVGERVDPALRQVALGVGLDVDGDVLVDASRAACAARSSCSCGCVEDGNSLAPASASVNTGFGTLRSA